MEPIGASIEQAMAKLLPLLPPEVTKGIESAMAMSPEQRLEEKCRAANGSALSQKEREKSHILSCYSCDKCKNKGIVYFPSEGKMVIRQCACMSIRGSIMRANSSGLAETLKRCKFSNFREIVPWHTDVKRKVMEYAKNPVGWLYLAGQPGSGKTHLCTAALGRLIHTGMEARYMLWKNEGTALVGKVNSPEYQQELEPLLSVKVLYIDDFLKTERGESGRPVKPTTGHINLAFQIINSRYADRKLTILSSEHSIDEIISYDEALGSRIFEMAQKNAILLPWGPENNYRLRRDDE